MASTGEAWRLGRRPALGQAFETRPNALNAVRLALALTVIVWHAYSLADHTFLPEPVRRLLADVPVDAFFAISGFLICRAWHRRPDLRRFAAARARRILPGLWACLLVTAFVIAPLATMTADRPPLTLEGRWTFVLGNATTWHAVLGIDGGPAGLPWSGTWNGSLWSLGYEAACYLAVAALGIAGLLRPRVLAGIAVTFWILSAAMVSAGVPSLFGVLRIPRIGLMFACGALLWSYRDRIPVDRRLAWTAGALLVVGSLLPDYRLVAAPAVAYLALHLGVELGRHPRLVLEYDLSYGAYVYAFPIQQSLLLIGFTSAWLPFAAVSLLCTLPVAAASWFVIERPAMRLGRRQRPEEAVKRGLAHPLVADDHLVDRRSSSTRSVDALTDVEVP